MIASNAMPSNLEQSEQTLNDAIARNAGIVLSLPSSDLIQNIKSRFLAQGQDGIWAELDRGVIAQAGALAKGQTPLAVSFRTGKRRVTFVTRVLAVDSAFRFNEHTVVPAVLVARPTEINVTQRRSAYRVVAFQDAELSVRIWTIEDHAYLGDRPLFAQEIKAQISDASVGGLGVRILRPHAQEKNLATGQRLRVLLQYRGIELLLDARLRLTPRWDNSDSIAAGVMFKKLDADVDARQKFEALTQIIGELQVEEVRRTRLSAA
jgi:c-di-GMP-binding flagellar brake protein YcgR